MSTRDLSSRGLLDLLDLLQELTEFGVRFTYDAHAAVVADIAPVPERMGQTRERRIATRRMPPRTHSPLQHEQAHAQHDRQRDDRRIERDDHEHR